MNLLERLLMNAEAGIAGIIGAVVAVPFQEELNTWQGRLMFVFTGLACAYFATPLAISTYGIDPALAGGVGFLMGAFGGSLLSAGFRTVRNLDLSAFVKAKLGKRGDNEQ